MKDPYLPSTDDVYVELVGPEEAAKYLATNHHNRNVKVRKVAQYAHDMRTGHWYWNGQTICFDKNSELIDGQNRLLAVIEADVVLPFLVVRNVERRAQESIDTGAARTFADALKLRGERHWNVLAGTVGLIAVYENEGELKHVFVRPSIQELMDTFTEHSWIRDLMTDVVRWSKSTPLTPSAIGFLAWLLVPVAGDDNGDNDEPNDAQFFFERLADGVGLPEGHPVLVLRNTLLNHRQARFTKMDHRTQVAMAIKAWNKYRNGELTTSGGIRFRQGGASPEPFPVPR